MNQYNPQALLRAFFDVFALTLVAAAVDIGSRVLTGHPRFTGVVGLIVLCCGGLGCVLFAYALLLVAHRPDRSAVTAFRAFSWLAGIDLPDTKLPSAKSDDPAAR